MYSINQDAHALVVSGVQKAKILVIRYQNVGDVMLSSVVCNTLKRTFPKARVDFLICDTDAELFVNHPYIDRVIALEPAQVKNPIQYWRTIRRITTETYDLVVDLQSSMKSELVSALARKHAICIGQKKNVLGNLASWNGFCVSVHHRF